MAEFEVQKTPDQEALEKIIEIKRSSKEQIKKVKQELKQKKLEQKNSGKVVSLSKADKLEKKQLLREAKRLEYVTRKNRYSPGEEIFNSIASCVGAGLAIAATVLLILRAVFYSPTELKAFYVTGVSVFGGTLILMYLISTLYHALAPIGAKKIFAILDHCSVYIFVAGTYTPFCLGAFHGTQGWVLFGIIWALATIGVVLYAVYGSHMRIASAVTYFFMGWMIIVAIKPVSAALPSLSLLFLVLGGVVYTLGIFFYAMKSMKWFHSIWHLFVIAGSILHFFAVFFSIG
ncbi:MAG: hemolysin III family protein [Paludibacteraceae bacterium]|nr:hemolysin III family protein [Paludibacteraceae bacterium]